MASSGPAPTFKVLHIGDEMAWRGAENQILLLARGLRKFNVESVIAYPKGSQGLDIFSKEFKTVSLPSRKPLDPRNLWALLKAIDQDNIAIVNSHSSHAMSMALKVKTRRPSTILVAHRRVAVPMRRNWFSRRKYFNPLIDQYVCISSAIGAVLVEAGMDPKKVAVVKSAVEATKYDALERTTCRKYWVEPIAPAHKATALGTNEAPGASPAASAPWVGYAGAMTAEKGVDVFLEALQKLRAQGMAFFAPIAGAGRGLEQYKQMAQELGLTEHVHFYGHVTEMPSFLKSLDILAVPSTSEGLGTIILDGILAGATVVGSNVGGIPEIIHHRETGLLIEPAQPELWAQALEQLIKDTPLREKLSRQARAHVLENFSLQAMVEGNFKIYKTLIEKK